MHELIKHFSSNCITLFISLTMNKFHVYSTYLTYTAGNYRNFHCDSLNLFPTLNYIVSIKYIEVVYSWVLNNMAEKCCRTLRKLLRPLSTIRCYCILCAKRFDNIKSAKIINLDKIRLSRTMHHIWSCAAVKICNLIRGYNNVLFLLLFFLLSFIGIHYTNIWTEPTERPPSLMHIHTEHITH